MNKNVRTKLVREGNYIAEVDVAKIESNDDWSPHISLEDALKLDKVRHALQTEDVKTASQLGRVYTLTPVAIAQ